ncbi:MAG: phosphate acyltransferase PlsX [Acidimicrobiia bacterium]
MSVEQVTVAIDAMGGDHAPDTIVAGALAAVEQLGVRVLLAGQEDRIRALLPDGETPEGVELLPASEVIAMDDEPATSVRTKKDASMTRAAEAVRDGKAQALVGAGNTGATMAAALLRFGRIKGVARPAIAVPVPAIAADAQLLVDAGATVDCQPDWILQFGLMAREYARVRLGVDEPTVGLLSNGEEAGKGDELRKAVFPILQAQLPGFVGNCEGRDIMGGSPNVVLTDGFTGNIALKTAEGAVRAVAKLVFEVLDSTPEAREAAKVITPLLLERAKYLDPEHTGGALLLGVDGVCIISHGSSGSTAIINAVRAAKDAVEANVIDRLKEAAQHAG